MKTCIYCAEDIQEAAIKCRYCGEFLDGQVRTSRKKKEGMKWYFVMLLCLLLGPFALHIIWMHPNYGILRKAVLTVVIIGGTFGMVYGTQVLCTRLLGNGQMITELEQQLRSLGY